MAAGALRQKPLLLDQLEGDLNFHELNDQVRTTRSSTLPFAVFAFLPAVFPSNVKSRIITASARKFSLGSFHGSDSLPSTSQCAALPPRTSTESLEILISTSCVIRIEAMFRRKCGQKMGSEATMVARLTSSTLSTVVDGPYHVGSKEG